MKKHDLWTIFWTREYGIKSLNSWCANLTIDSWELIENLLELDMLKVYLKDYRKVREGMKVVGIKARGLSRVALH